MNYCISKQFLVIFLFCFSSVLLHAQVPANINSGNPNFPFPQFLDYNGGALQTLGSSAHNMVGVPHAELELRIREAYEIMCNDMTYTGESAGGVQYIYPTAPQSCTCVEGDGYYLLAAAYMGDKATFNGYYMWAHDRGFNKTVRFIDGGTNSATYLYSKPLSGAGGFGASTATLGGAAGGNSAADGDFDVAMALLVAYKQWGANSGVFLPALGGAELNYRNEALAYIHGLVDANPNPTTNTPTKWDMGDIGLDGYVKGGDTWNELTGWATTGYMGMIPEFTGPRTQHIDYYAPAYFRSFYELFTAEGQDAFSINQFKRAEASSDWLIGQMAAQNLVGFAGWVDLSSGTPAFSAFDIGEDFRTPWRTNLNYVWNGNPTTSWNAATHQVVAGGNTYEYDLTKNAVTFFNNPQAYGNAQISAAGVPVSYCGPITVQQQHLPDGTGGNAFRLSWPHATFSPAATAQQDFDLMAKMYRQCEITWDGNTDVGQQYLASKPRYFHEWFRLLGMLILSGNYHDPMNMIPTANMKVYKDIDKTYAFVGDTITYTITYRNYGKPDATSVQIVDNLPAGLKYLSSSAAATVGGSSVTFNVGTVKGTNIGLPANLSQTTGSITMKAIVQSGATGRLCNTATITCSNGTGWTSNEYPNNVTEVMQRNCVDILTQNALTLTKTPSKTTVQVGDTLSYTLVVKNKSVDFLNGGREGVQVAFGHDGPLSTSSSEVKLNFRIYHGAQESYINYKNYRLSYFLNKAGPPTWQIGTPLSIDEGFGTGSPTIAQQNLTPGAGYNHRFFITFPDEIGTITPYILNYDNNAPFIHRGSLVTPRIEMRVYDPAAGLWDWTTDWSADPNITVAAGDAYFPVGDDWTDPLNPGIPVTKIHPDACANVTYVTKKVLVEEWDGYTWRRAYGNAPVSGRQLNNVRVTDTLPSDVVFGGFFPGYPVGTVSGNVITWPTIANMNINDSVAYRFWVTVKPAAFFGCPAAPNPATIVNKAGVTADKERTVLASATTNVSCTAVIVTSPALTKTADKTSYAVGDNIVYTITHKNLYGSIVSGATVAADWNDVAGNGKMTVNAAGAVDLNTGSVNKIMTYKYSHGTDGTVKGSLTLGQYQQTYAIVVRQNGNKWVEVRFNVQFSNVQISVYDYGITAAGAYTQLGATQTIPYTNLPGKFDFQIALSGSQLNFWLVNPGVMMSSTPQLIFTGIPVQAGYAGVRSSVGGAALLENWYTNLDSEFNVQVTDPLLSNLSFVSATSATYNAVTYTASNVAGVVTWQSIAGPVLKNSQITYTWTAKVTACSAATITNVAYAKVYGITPDLAATNTVACASTAASCHPPVTLTAKEKITALTRDTLCVGNTLTLQKNAVDTSTASANGFYYYWAKKTNGVYSKLTATVKFNAANYADYSKTTVAATDSGTYYLVVQDGSGVVASTCKDSASVYIVVSQGPVTKGLIASNQEICKGATAAALTQIKAGTGTIGSPVIYKWYTSPDSVAAARTKITGATTSGYTPPAATPATTTYYVRTDSVAHCAAVKTNFVKVQVNNKPILTKIVPVLRDTLCVGELFNLSTTIKLSDTTGANASLNGGYYFTWKKLQAGILQSSAGPAPYAKYLSSNASAALADSGQYWLIVQDGVGAVKCKDSISIRIVVNQPPLVKGIIQSNQEICKGDAAAVITEKTAPQNYVGYPLYYQWYKATDTTGTVVVSKLTGSVGATYNPGTPVLTQYFVRKDSIQYCAAVATNYVKIRVNNTVILDSVKSITGDTLCVNLGDQFQLKGYVDSTAAGKASINGGYYFTWKKVQSPSTVPVTVGTPGKYANYPVTARNVTETDSGTYYLIVQDGNGATKCQDTLKIKIVVIKNCVSITPVCVKPNLVSTQLMAGANDTVCVGSSFTIQKNVIDTSGGPSLYGYYFSWRRVNDAGSVLLTPPSKTYSDLVISSAAELDSGRYYLIVQDGLTSNTLCKDSSAAISIGVNKPIAVAAVISASDTICEGSAPLKLIEKTPSSGSTGVPYRYQWYVSADSFKTVAGTSAINAATSKEYQPGALSITTYYRRIDSAGVCASDTTNTVTITVDKKITQARIGDDTVVCAGSPVSMFKEITANTGGTDSFTHQWQSSLDNSTFTDISGATGVTYQAVNIIDTTYFRRVDKSGVCPSVSTDTIEVDVVTGVNAGTVSGPPATICYNTIPPTGLTSLTDASGGSGGISSRTYQWQESTDQIVWTDIPGATGANCVQATRLTDTTYFRRRVGMGIGSCDTNYTAVIAINVYAPLTPGSLAADTTICSGTPLTITELTAAGGGGEPGSQTYQWIASTDNGLSWSNASGTSNGKSYTPSPALTDTILYKRIVIAACGKDTTNAIQVNVDSTGNVTVSLQPVQTCKGTAVTFTATPGAEGTSPQYTWQSAPGLSGPWTTLTTGAASTYTVTNPQPADSGTVYKVILTSSYQCANGTANATAVLSVTNAVVPKVAVSSNVPNPVCDGFITHVTYTATPVAGQGTAPTYQWYDAKTNQIIPGAVADTYTTAAAPANGDGVYVIMQTNAACATAMSATSDPVTITVVAPPAPKMVTKDTTICSPNGVILYTSNTASGSTFQWYKNSAAIPGATSTTYMVNPSEIPGGAYSFVEDNGVCTEQTTFINVKIVASPSVNAGADISAVEGELVTLNGSVSNATSYAWVPAGGLSDPYSLNPQFKASASTTYVLQAFNNGSKCEASDAVTVTVEAAIKIPNVITINGDGSNDTWNILHIENYPNATFEIYNRWGNLVWKSTGYPKQWDGTNYRNGEVLPDGTYFYIINLHSTRFTDPYTGWVQIVK